MTALAGRYTLDVPLGDSDLGTVWNAHDQDGTLLVVVTLEEDAPEALQERFRAHAKALVKITHPSVVHAIAEGEENGSPYLVLERLTGESLATRLEAGPAPTVGRMVEIAVTLSEALTAVHAAGISHGDVEPGNVLLVGEPGREVPKLIGFALNRASVRQELAARASLPSLGPVAYAAPEQARGEVIDGPLADQASLAALVYAALSGRPPHIARDVAGLAVAIGNDKAPTLTLARRELAPFASTIDKALSPDPKKRFAEIGAFGRALKTAGNMARTVATSPVPLGERSAIGEPPAPALPKAATIPKPSPMLGAAKLAPMGPGKPAVVIPRPGAVARTTQELDIADLKPASAPMAQPSGRPTEELEIADILAATGVTPKVEAEPAKAAPEKVEPARAELAPIAPTATKAMFLPPLVPKVEAPKVEAPKVEAPKVEAKPAEAPKPPSPKPPIAPPTAIIAPPAATVESSSEDESTELQSIPPEMRTSDPDGLETELMSIPPPAPAPPPPPHDHAEAKPPPPPPDHADHKPPPPPAAKKEPAPKPVVVDEPSVSLSPSLEKIAIAEAAKPKPLSFPPSPTSPASGPPSEARPAWMVPAAIAAVVVLALVSWALYRTMQSDTSTDDGAPGRTLTTTVPETSVTPPPSTVIAAPPVTEVTPPPTIVPPATRLLPPSTTHGIPPGTGVRPPVTTRPPTTGVRPPPTTGARPPTTGVRPPPTTGVRPPPTTGVRRPPPTTTTRPTVVSDPGF